MLNINNGFHWCIVNFCMKQSWLNEMGPRAGRAQLQCALPHQWLDASLGFSSLSLLLCHGAASSLWKLVAEGLAVDVTALCLSILRSLVVSAGRWLQAVEGVSNKDWKQQQTWEKSQLGECPQYCGQSGRRLVAKMGERREGRTGRWSTTVLSNYFHVLSVDTYANTLCLILKVLCFTCWFCHCALS